MKRAAFGIRMHSGWGIMVAVSDAMEVVDRRRIVVTNDHGPRGNQPFHHAEELGLTQAETYLSQYRVESERLAREAITLAVEELQGRGYRLAAVSILLASGRPLPGLPQILESHPLIHTAEGELFREVVRGACESLKINVMKYRERDLEEIAKAVLGSSTTITDTTQKLALAGKALGPPWTADHKVAALSAYVALHDKSRDKVHTAQG